MNKFKKTRKDWPDDDRRERRKEHKTKTDKRKKVDYLNLTEQQLEPTFED